MPSLSTQPYDRALIPEVELSQIAAITPSLPTWNVGAENLLPFEQELVDIVNEFRSAVDPDQRASACGHLQRIS